jgi:hypothetical protein
VILPKKIYIAVTESDKGAFSAEEREAAKSASRLLVLLRVSHECALCKVQPTSRPGCDVHSHSD